MKRFYKAAESGTAPGGHVVRLDGKTLRTPLGKPLIVGSPALATAMAAEWQAQGAEVVPASMPLCQLAYTMIDKAEDAAERRVIEAEICRYGASDLVCYFAQGPDSLLQRQKAAWEPLIAWLADAAGARLTPVEGIRYVDQSPESLAALARFVSGLNPAAFTVAQAVTACTGSAVIALALAQGRIDAEEAHAAAFVDETYQMEQWGEDALARKKMDAVRADLGAAALFLDLVKSSD